MANLLQDKDRINYYQHQSEAIKKTVENDFSSGLYCHATGTGKTITALGIVEQFNIRYPDKNVIWFCERKGVLVEMRSFIKKTFPKLTEKFFLVEYVSNKDKQWCQKLSALRIWGRPLFILINRAFLTSQSRYEEIKIPISLVIHDESHSAGAEETYQFLKMMQVKGAKLLGFSATPLKWSGHDQERISSIYPKMVSLFHFREAVNSGAIVAPRLVWLPNNVKTFDRYSILSWMPILNSLFIDLPYRKMIVWTGTIKSCIDTALEFKIHQSLYDNLAALTATIDISEPLSREIEKDEKNTVDYKTFVQNERDGILFCAMKHREGSDIHHLDSCLFLDGVRNRTDISFIQSMGRVLRKDPEGKKKYGLIIDSSASDFTYYYNYLNRYLLDTEHLSYKEQKQEQEKCLETSTSKEAQTLALTQAQVQAQVEVQTERSEIMVKGLHHYHYDIEQVNIAIDLQIEITTLDFKRSREEAVQQNLDSLRASGVAELQALFTRKVPKIDEYLTRLSFELSMIEENGYIYYLLQVVEILKLIGDIPKIIRGSCGSSLVCFLLGITNIDPVKYKIKFVRFLNNSRKSQPDIDIDFPYYVRSNVFQIIERHWPGRVARISNHLYFRDRSSLREAIRMLGYRKQIKNEELPNFLMALDDAEKYKLQEHIDKLEGTFRGYSLHCGGIVVFENGIPPELLLRTRASNQICYDKRDVQKHNHFKIDILSNRGLAVLITVSPQIPIESYKVTPDIYRLLASGDNIGLTFAESRTMRRALVSVKPKSVSDVAFCLAIIRPAFSDGLKEAGENENQSVETDEIIIHGNRLTISNEEVDFDFDDSINDNLTRVPAFDDDIINMLEQMLDCDAESADRIRRGFAKGEKEAVEEFKKNYENHPKYSELLVTLGKLRKYGFCKSHAISYAQLVVGLARAKLDHPKEFWLALLNHSQSSYRKWVYWREARKAGWKLTICQKPYYGENGIIVGNKKRNIKQTNSESSGVKATDLTPLEELKTYGYWKSPYFIPNCYLYFNKDKTRAMFRGIIATGGTVNRKGRTISLMTIGYDDGCYVDLVILRAAIYSRYLICEGEGSVKCDKTGYYYLESTLVKFT